MNIDFQPAGNTPKLGNNSVKTNLAAVTNTTGKSELVKQGGQTQQTEEKKATVENKPKGELSELDYVTELKYNKAAELLQSITTNPITDKVISKMPPDEFLRLKDMLQNISSGFIDKKV